MELIPGLLKNRYKYLLLFSKQTIIPVFIKACDYLVPNIHLED